jgi:hypothetical protein
LHGWRILFPCLSFCVQICEHVHRNASPEQAKAARPGPRLLSAPLVDAERVPRPRHSLGAFLHSS